MAGWRLLVLLGSVLASAANPQDRVSSYPQQHERIEFEDDWVRVLRVSLDPGEKTAVQEHLDGVLVFLTADLEGRMPPAEALWQPAGSRVKENSAARSSTAAAHSRARDSLTPRPSEHERAPDPSAPPVFRNCGPLADL
jgi:hypothetical protein